jgi:hypothetical protein
MRRDEDRQGGRRDEGRRTRREEGGGMRFIIPYFR